MWCELGKDFLYWTALWNRLDLPLSTQDLVGDVQRTVAGAIFLQIGIAIHARTDDVLIFLLVT